jgi:hypothetical protein
MCLRVGECLRRSVTAPFETSLRYGEANSLEGREERVGLHAPLQHFNSLTRQLLAFLSQAHKSMEDGRDERGKGVGRQSRGDGGQ